jgi:hypothetical protein
MDEQMRKLNTDN